MKQVDSGQLAVDNAKDRRIVRIEFGDDGVIVAFMFFLVVIAALVVIGDGGSDQAAPDGADGTDRTHGAAAAIKGGE